MTRISRISNPRATLCAVALLTAVMLTLGAFSADPASAAVPLAGETAAAAAECQPAAALPCPYAISDGSAAPGGR